MDNLVALIPGNEGLLPEVPSFQGIKVKKFTFFFTSKKAFIHPCSFTELL